MHKGLTEHHTYRSHMDHITHRSYMDLSSSKRPSKYALTRY